MRRSVASALVALVVLVACLARTAPAAEPLPTQGDIQQTFDRGKYPLVLQELNRVLVLKGAAAKAYDRHALLRLKGETHLRMKAAAPAAQAFADAAAETEDAQAADVDRATALLIKRSSQQAYAPKARGPKGREKAAEAIGIVEPDGRKRALAALFEDEYAAGEPKVSAVRNARQLAPILDVLPAVRDLRSLERAANSHDARTKELVTRLAGRARDLMAEAVRDMTPKVADIEKKANEYVPYDELSIDPDRPGRQRSTRKFKKKGIDRREALVLQDSIAALERIGGACRDLADAFKIESVDFGAVRADAGKLARQAGVVLNSDYSKSYTRPPGS
jgi:hypothetical protein